MTRSYDLTKLARADLREITRYSNKQWGRDQTRAYIRHLEQSAEAVARGSGVYQDMNVLYPNLRMVHTGRHYILCLPRKEAPALIIAFFHDRVEWTVANPESRRPPEWPLSKSAIGRSRPQADPR